MASIIERPRSDGSITYLVQIVKKRKGKIIFRANGTFDTEKAAKAWVVKKEREISRSAGEVLYVANRGRKLRDAIDIYMEKFSSNMGKTKKQVLNSIKKDPIADMSSGVISSDDLVEFAERLFDGREPSTVGTYMSHLSAVFKVARPAWKIPLDYQAMLDAIVVCKMLGYVARSNERDRRPTIEELERILTYFEHRCLILPKALPMHKIVGFALFSTRRMSEIIRMDRSHLERESQRVLVKDMKHPGEKRGNDVRCVLPDPSIAILDSMPETNDLFFPYHKDSVSRNFTDVCKVLEIEDLHFHDLRHEGISRLFEMDKTIPRVAEVSGHRDWKSLQRYTHLRATGDKYEGWEWIDRLCT